MEKQFDIAIIGAGLIGSSIAYHLSKQAQKGNAASDIALLDIDYHGRYSSSELNAGGIRAEWMHTVNIELAKATLDYMTKDPDEFGFRQNGYLWLLDEAGWKAYALNKGLFREHGLKIEELTPEGVQKWLPYIDKTDGIRGAILMPNDGLFNPNLLKQHYRTLAKTSGVVAVDGAWVQKITKHQGYIEVTYVDIRSRTGHVDEHHVLDILRQHSKQQYDNVKTIKCKRLVNAAGAWAPILSKMYGHELPCKPVRRQVSIFDCQGLDLSRYGMIVDTTGIYFHAEADHILAGYATPNEPEGYNFKYDADWFFESEIWPRLYHRMSKAEALKHITGWAGLYSQTPDKSGILGRVDKDSEIYEAHSFTGRGAMQSYGVGMALSELITTGGFKTIDASPLHPKRFCENDGKLLYEGFHI